MSAVLAFAALAVDLSVVADTRRADQIAADTAALAAVHDLGDEEAMVATIADIAGRQLDVSFTAADFDTCGSEAQPSGFTPISGSDCISVDESGSRVRVRLPVRSQSTVFGPVVGVDDFEHTAVAIAGLTPLGYGRVLPFGVPSSASGLACLKIGSGNVSDSDCNDNSSGNFGMLNFGFFGDPQLGTVESCNGDGKGRLANNIAVGADHQLSLWAADPHGSAVVVDAHDCGNLGHPNSADTLTGNVPSKVGDGIFSGTLFSDGGPARLQRPGPSWGLVASVAGHDLDDNPLWEYIPKSYPGWNVPDSCHRDQFVGPGGGLDTDNDGELPNLPADVANHVRPMTLSARMIALLDRCMTHWQGSMWANGGAFVPGESPSGCASPCDPVFSRNSANDAEANLYDIQYSPRFGYVPRLVEDSDDLNGTTDVRFQTFEPIFIQRLLGGNCGSGGCDIDFEPGIGYSVGGNATKAAALTAFVLPRGMLPGQTGDAEAVYEIGTNLFIQLYG